VASRLLDIGIGSSNVNGFLLRFPTVLSAADVPVLHGQADITLNPINL
jgi:hypothetical protein